jgi:hypothetical protein
MCPIAEKTIVYPEIEPKGKKRQDERKIKCANKTCDSIEYQYLMVEQKFKRDGKVIKKYFCIKCWGSR